MGLADIFKSFGKAAAEYDRRTLNLSDILRKQDAPGGGSHPSHPFHAPPAHPPPHPHPPMAGGPGDGGPAPEPPPPPEPPEDASLPEEYDFDEAFAAESFHGRKRKGIPTPTFGNIKYKNCVIAGRAHQTLRFELSEQNRLIRIRTQDVMDEFFKETGGKNKPLSVLASLKLWRKVGWKVAGKTHKIQIFARINRKKREEIKRAIQMDLGVGLGFILPDSAVKQWSKREPWNVVRKGGERSKAHFGHYVYVSGYTKLGPVCVTWGRKQPMSWAFVNKYCDEAYAIIDEINTSKKKRYLDVTKIHKYLENCAECKDG